MTQAAPAPPPDDTPSAASPKQATGTPTELSGWGRYPVVTGTQRCSEDFAGDTATSELSRGLGKSYGDASLPVTAEQPVTCSVRADRFIDFDAERGVVRIEAGLSLGQLNAWSLPRGWFTPVTPGTQYVTLGGMVASDVHGKNHHVNGCFGEHVQSLKMRVADGQVIECSDTHEQELFRATLGGMGLTGHILEVAVALEKIPTPWIWQEVERVENIEAVIERVQEAGSEWPYTVTWADCFATGKSLGRSVLMKGRWAEPGEAPQEFQYAKKTITFPFTMPNWFVNPLAVRTFNWLKYHAPIPKAGIVHPFPFFYPLDVLLEWNRLYGRRGFTQHQAVLPVGNSLTPHRRYMERVAASGKAFLCVIKDCGPEGKGMLSFPRPGISYALDFPVDAETQALVNDLNELTLAEGGRVYLAKDAFTSREDYAAMDPRVPEWLAVRHKWDPTGRLRSAQSARLFDEE